MFITAAFLGCSNPLTTREKTAGAGTVVGYTVGAGIGSTFGYAGTGGIAGAVLGLCVGAVVGVQAEALEKQRNDLEQKIQQCDRDIQRQSDKLEELKKELEER
jgi:outer membrane lipoprotein SlyB